VGSEVVQTAGETSEMPQKKRRYELDVRSGKVIKHDPEPNMVMHKDPVKQTQLKLAEAPAAAAPAIQPAASQPMPEAAASSSAGAAPAASAPQRGSIKASPFTIKQQDYIAKSCFEFLGDFAKGKSPPNFKLEEILKTGIAAGVLPNTATLEQVRSVARTKPPLAAKDRRCFHPSAT
jgi:hypothetical protein